ncbi:hypothetical protein SLNSH_22815 [Alsobacter soli]|uniref:Uncharacterized protein n=1 Tax=Alsobacter soli TaxID=2109933 RepID=A0A2T1HM37_9HYPH|nr:hypothetical protein [Alsobacter soli]PSC02696.1 hypothetical protein SLNSH_22815 [Alsobacter soli]
MLDDDMDMGTASLPEIPPPPRPGDRFKVEARAWLAAAQFSIALAMATLETTPDEDAVLDGLLDETVHEQLGQAKGYVADLERDLLRARENLEAYRRTREFTTEN